MSDLIIFYVNGKKYSFSSKLFFKFTLFHLLLHLNYNTKLIVIELNGIVIDSNNWPKIYLKNNDLIEIVTIVGGG